LSGKIKEELDRLWPGLDIRGDGGYAIFTGEINHGRYTWLRGPEPHPWEALPQDLREFLESAANPAAAPSPEEGAAGEVDPEELICRALKLIGTQGRNASGFWLATQLRDHQYSYEAALKAMQAYRSHCPAVNAKGQPEAYTESEMRATLEQAYSRTARGPWGRPNGRPTTGEHAPFQPSPFQVPAAPDPAAEEEDSRFALTEDGVFHTHQEKDKAGNLRPVTVKVCSPLEVVAYARDPNSETWGKLLKWPDPDQKEHSWVVPARMLVGDGSFRETLADSGLEIGTGPKNLLAQYVMSRRPQRRLLCAPQVGWLDRCFIAPEWVIPESSNVAYQSMGRGEHFYRISGTLEEWTENVGKKCRGNPLLTFLVSCALAGPLMRELNVQGGGFALEGESSIGKTTALIVAGSVWGGGGRLGFCRTFAATHAALESIAELLA
jgi:putative DNA primase/helicase